MIIIIGLVILIAAVVAGAAGVLSNSGSGHPLTHPFAILGYHVTGSTRTPFPHGIVVGALARVGPIPPPAGGPPSPPRSRSWATACPARPARSSSTASWSARWPCSG